MGGGGGEHELRVEPVARAIEAGDFRRAAGGFDHRERARFAREIRGGVQRLLADFHAPGFWLRPAEAQGFFGDADFYTAIGGVRAEAAEKKSEEQESGTYGEGRTASCRDP